MVCNDRTVPATRSILFDAAFVDLGNLALGHNVMLHCGIKLVLGAPAANSRRILRA
jgi:hypothetical protein